MVAGGEKMKLFDARSYSISDFLEWHQGRLLDLSPKFQRRSVWTRAAKSYLIDTIIRGKPMPKILLTQGLVERRNVRTVVDGQQRIRAIIEFTSDKFSVLKSHNQELGGVRFSELPNDVQISILQYEVGVDLLYNVELPDILDIFSRINAYSVALNNQEKINAKYIGPFKQIAYDTGHRYAEYMVSSKVISEPQLSRMAEAQFYGDVLTSLLAGVQSPKAIEKQYKLYEDMEEVPDVLLDARRRIDEAMAFIGAIYPPQELMATIWHRPHLFYTLLTCVLHAYSPLKGVEGEPRPPIGEEQRGMWRIALDDISAHFAEYSELGSVDIPTEYARFINYSQMRTTDSESRKERIRFVLRNIPNA